MQPPFPIKTPCRHFYTETIYKCSNHEHTFQDIQCKTQDINTYQKTPGDATAERGARFHPTVGSATPNGFTTSHPRARPRCCETESLFVRSRERRLLSFFSAYQSLCVFSRVLRFLPSCDLCRDCPLPHLFPAFSFSGEVACGMNFPAVVRSEASTDGRFTPIPH
jgi:hypothetical protein